MYTYSAVDADEKLVVSPPSWCLWKPSSKFSSVICLIVISSLFPACFLAGRASTVVKKSGIERKSSPRQFACIWLSVLLFEFSLFTFSLHFYWKNRLPICLSVDPVSIVFQSNRTFLQRPSLESDQIWFSLYPADNGFFNYPTKKPLRSTFAGFHQLHCVVGIPPPILPPNLLSTSI